MAERDSCPLQGLLGGDWSSADVLELEFGINGVRRFAFPRASRGG